MENMNSINPIEEKSSAQDTELNLALEIAEHINEKSNLGERLRAFHEIISLLHLVDYPEMMPHGLEVFSDQSLSPADINFIVHVKNQYDAYLNGGNIKPIQVFILNQKHWPVIAKCFGSNDPFSGQSQEIPVTPFGMPSVMLPSVDAVALETERKVMFRQLTETNIEISKVLDNMDDNDKEEAYKLFYLRSMMAHEILHLYQFSQNEIATINLLSEDETQKAVEIEKFLPLREWLACAMSLYVLKDEPTNRMKILLGAYEIAAEKFKSAQSLSPEQRYPLHQSFRAIQGNRFLILCGERSADPVSLLAKMNRLCVSEDSQIKLRLQEILEGEMNEEKFDQILNLLYQIPD